MQPESQRPLSLSYRSQTVARVPELHSWNFTAGVTAGVLVVESLRSTLDMGYSVAAVSAMATKRAVGDLDEPGLKEVRPGVWHLRVYAGRRPSGSPIQYRKTVDSGTGRIGAGIREARATSLIVRFQRLSRWLHHPTLQGCAT
jgi:hypothetical protein